MERTFVLGLSRFVVSHCDKRWCSARKPKEVIEYIKHELSQGETITGTHTVRCMEPWVTADSRDMRHVLTKEIREAEDSLSMHAIFSAPRGKGTRYIHTIARLLPFHQGRHSAAPSAL